MKLPLIFATLSILLLVTACTGYEPETISIVAHGINEECDKFNHLWEVDSVSNVDYEFLIGELLYSKLASNELGDNRKNHNRNERLFAEGRLSEHPQMEDFTCRNTWFLLTDKCRIEK